MNTLVDTSVWSFALRRKPADLSRRERAIAAELSELVKEGNVRIIGPVRQEFLSGLKTEGQYEKLRAKLSAFQDEPLQTPVMNRQQKRASNAEPRDSPSLPWTF
jgi:predicted nucleic acid-binding protein